MSRARSGSTSRIATALRRGVVSARVIARSSAGCPDLRARLEGTTEWCIPQSRGAQTVSVRLAWPDGRCASFRIAASRRIWNHLQITAGPASGHDGSDSAAHNVLAAEAFALPLADPAIRPRPVVLPDDPTGIGQPHDVLAAEEFAMP